MDLTTALGTQENITEQNLLSLFEQFSAEHQFIILEPPVNGFMQTTEAEAGSFVLEYQEDHQQFQCVGTPSKSEVQATFLKYLKGDPSWKTDHGWKPLDLGLEPPTYEAPAPEKPWWKFW